MPPGSFAQIVAVGRRIVSSTNNTNSSDSSSTGKALTSDLNQDRRPSLAEGENREEFMGSVKQARAEFDQGEINVEELSRFLYVGRLLPLRMELLISGEVIWERFEWANTTSDSSDFRWSAPRRLLPY